MVPQLIAIHGNDVKSVALGRRTEFGDIRASGRAQPLGFTRGDTFFRKRAVSARFDFHEHQFITIKSDQVQFAPTDGAATGDQRPTAIQQILGNPIFYRRP